MTETPTPPAEPTLFNADDLGEWLGKTVTDAKAVIVERVVWGWLKPVLGLSERPSTGTTDGDHGGASVFSWAIELGAIAHENPAGLSAQELGTSRRQFSSERRSQILDEARSTTSGTSTTGPQGDFPPAPVYPDPARPATARW